MQLYLLFVLINFFLFRHGFREGGQAKPMKHGAAASTATSMSK